MVLIADADVARGRKLASACAALSIDVRRVADGAAALEAAIIQNPAAMIAQVDLPLIDGQRLAEILHANPHTCTMGMLLIGSDGVADAANHGRQETPDAGDAKGQVVSGRTDPDTIARFVQVMLQKRQPGRTFATAGSGAPDVEGKLSQIGLAELIELFHVNRKTGVITLRQGAGRRAESGRILLREGDVVAARTGAVEGEKALFRLLAWRRGNFVFREEDDGSAREIERPTRELLREAQRQDEESKRLGDDIPARQSRVSLRVGRSTLPNVLQPVTQEVLLVLELSDTVADVLDRVSFPDSQVLRTLQMLIRRKMVAVDPSTAKTEAPTGALLSPQSIGRLREWLEQGRPRHAAPLDAKVVAMAPDAPAEQAFASLLSRCPSVEATPRGDAEGVWSAFRIPLDADTSIEIITVPAGERWAPIWPLAMHGALATVFVHGDDLEHSVAALRRAIGTVASAPWTRPLHLVAEGKREANGDRSATEELCERLGLFDDRSILAIAPEGPDEGEKAVRDLIARLLP